MKVLIINGFSKNPQGIINFKNYESLIKQAFHEQRHILGNTIFFVCDPSNIDDFIYNPQLPNQTSKKNFDNLDLVFMDGDANLLPWFRSSQKFAQLFKLCKRANKWFFVSGFGFYMLIYYCATGFEEVRVINGRGRGSMLQNILDIPQRSLKKLQRRDTFLDHSTGDLYIFNHETKQWIPVANTGLHLTKAADFGGITSKLVKVTQKYRANSMPKQVYSIFPGSQAEIICHLKNTSVQHYVFQDIPQSFLVGSKNAWSVHPVNITKIAEVKENYRTMAEGEKGPLIIEHLNTLATQFHIQAKYKETVKILSNYVSKKSQLFLTNAARNDKPLLLTIEQEKKAQFEERSLLRKRLSNISHQTPKIQTNDPPRNTKSQTSFGYTKQFCHSGKSFSKRKGPIIVENNATTKSSIPINIISRSSSVPDIENSNLNEVFIAMKSDTTFPSTPSQKSQIFMRKNSRNSTHFTSTHNLLRRNNCQSLQNHFQNLKKSENGSLQSDHDISISSRPTTVRNSPDSRGKTSNSIFSFQNRSLMSSCSCRSLANSPFYKQEMQYRQNLIQDALQKDLSTKEIREKLHPDLPEEYLPKDKSVQIPGMRSFNSLFCNKSKIIQVNPGRVTPYCLYRQFQKMPKNDLSKPCIRISSPFQSQEDIDRKEFLESKQKWVSPNNFRPTSTKIQDNFIKNYVIRDPSEPPALHNFRATSKDKWVSPFGFIY